MRLTRSCTSIIKGPQIWGQISTTSVGINLFEIFKSHPNPQQPALLDASTKQCITFGKLWESTSKLGSYLRRKRIGQGDVISVCSSNNLNFFTPVISALYEGAATATISHTYSDREILHAIKLVKPKMIFCSSMVYDTFLKLQRAGDISGVKELHVLEELDKFSQEEIDDYEPMKLFNVRSQTALILFSSGTTGLPKGVMLSHGNLNVRQNQAEDSRLILHYLSDSVIVFPFYHSFGFNSVLGNILQGKTRLFLPKFTEPEYLKTIQDFKLTTLLTVPPLCVFLAKSPLVDEYDLSSVKIIFCGGAPLGSHVEKALKDRLPNVERIFQAYGLTEATLAVLLYGLNNKPRPGSSGRVIPGHEIIIRDPSSGEHLGAGKVGELCIKGPVVMQGYFDNEEATKNSFTDDGWLRSGDMAYYDKDEYFYIVDRLKELIKYKAFQVPPAELEALLLAHEAIREAAVVGLPDEKCGELPVAFVVRKFDCTISDIEILEFIRKQVSKDKRLHHVWFISEIPKTASGKILRKDLRQLAIKFAAEREIMK